MILTAAGNLGLGNGFTSPAYLLDVSGSSRFGFTSTNTHQFTGSVSVVGSVTAASFTGSLSGSITSALTASYLTPTNSYTITNLTASNISASATGSFGIVGIGTNNPAYKLDVSGSVFVSGIGTKFSGPAYEDGYRLKFYDNGGVTNDPGIGLDGAALGSEILWFNALNGFYWYVGTSGEKMRLTSAGNLGIGTSSPGSKLQINDTNPTLTLRANDGLSRKAFIDFYTTFFNYAPDTGSRRTSTIVTGFDSGTWGTEFMSFNVGSGSSNDAGLLPIERVRIDGSGNLGIGTSSPAYKLDVKGNVFVANAANGNNTIAFGNIGGLGPLNGAPDNLTGSAFLVVSSSTASGAPSHMKFFTTTGGVCGERMRLAADGNVGIGSTSPAYKLDVGGTARVGDTFLITTGATADARLEVGSGRSGNGNSYLDLVGDAFYTDYGLRLIRYDTGANANSRLEHKGTGQLQLFAAEAASVTISTTSTERMRIASDGNVGIGTAAPAAKLEISGSSNSALLNIKSPISGAILYVSGSGAVGINTSTVGAYTLQVNGSFAATTKSFVIEHPTKAGKKLIYGSLESPYHGIRLTGRDTLVNGKCKIQLPDYMYKLILHDSVNIQLTGIKCNKTLYIDDINVPENYFTIAYDKTVFESYKTYDFFWDFTAIRADVPELQTEM
jgi:hypothetical protein